MSEAEKPRARFINRSTTPPIGWIYEIEHEGSKFTFQSPMHHGLMQQLRKWHADKQLEWPGDPEMRARIEHFICQRLPKGFCIGGPDNPVVPYLSVGMIRDATRLIMRRIFDRKELFVGQTEADRRAKICANCPANLHGICTSCAGNQFFDLFGWFIRAGKKTQYDSALDTCAVCKCLLRCKIWINQETLNALTKHEYPPQCWLHGTPAHVSAKTEEDRKNEEQDQ